MARRRGVYIFAARRTPFGKFFGALKDVSAPRLASTAIKKVFSDTGIEGEKIKRVDGVVLGQALPAGCGQAAARQAAFMAGLPESCRTESVNKVCASSLFALEVAANRISLGEAELIVAGGMESMSQAPYLLKRRTKRADNFIPEKEYERIAREHNTREAMVFYLRFLREIFIDSMLYDGLLDAILPFSPHMGRLADKCAKVYEISRELQDWYAMISAARTLHAFKSGKFNSQLAPVGEPYIILSADEGIREPDAQKLAKLKPVFSHDGTVTAGNASQISDGASAILLGSFREARKLGLRPQARIIAIAVHSQEPEWYTTAPVGAVKQVLRKAKLTLSCIDLIECNEAFAVVPLHLADALNLSFGKINIWGGAISIGHPLGASGTRILANLVSQLIEIKGRFGIAVACNGGGEAAAVLIENLRR